MQALRPFKHTGNSANIAYYRERGGDVWASVLRSDYDYAGPAGHRVATAKRIPDFHLTIYRDGDGEVARITHTPRTRPTEAALPARTIKRLVAEALS